MDPENCLTKLIAPDVKLGKNVKIRDFVNLYGCEIGDKQEIEMGKETTGTKRRSGIIAEFFDLYAYHRKHNVDHAKSKVEHYRKFKERVLPLLENSMPPLNIIDIGCGKIYPFCYLFNSDGHNVTGLDTQYISEGILKYLGMLRHNGIKVAMKSLFRDMIFTPEFRKILKSECKSSTKTSKITFIRSSAEEIQCPSDSFDVVFSFCAFEHISNIEKAISECARVVKPSGIIYITFHLFTSISGSHHPKWFHPDSDPPEDIPPWYHLRKKFKDNIPELDYGLNKCTFDDYRMSFRKHVDVIEEFSDKIEGKRFLTEDIRNELSKYTTEELLTAFNTILARKKVVEKI